MIKKDKVIIIIVSFNGKKYWSDLMPALSRERYNDFDLEIVVVDNNSSDGSVNYLRQYYPQITVIQNNENIGFVGANNLGYKYARQKGADYIFLLNQDTVVTPGFLQPLYDFAKDNSFGSLQPKLRLWPERNKINTIGNVIHYLGFGYGLDSGKVDDNRQEIRKINYASGAGVFLSMRVLKEFSGPSSPDGKQQYLFDETMFMYLEDLDLGWSLSLLGYDNFLIPKSVIYHKYEFDRGMKHFYWFERNRLWVMLKNYKWGSLLLIFPAYLLMELGQLFYALINRRLWQKLRAYAWLFSKEQRRILLFKRQRIQSKRRRSDREVVHNFSGVISFQELNSPLLSVANLIFRVYWLIINKFIFW